MARPPDDPPARRSDARPRTTDPAASGTDAPAGRANAPAAEPRPLGDAARATANAAAAIPRTVAWTARWSARRIRRGLRRAGVPLPRLHTFRRRSPVGAAPGTLISHPDARPPTIRVIGYGPDTLEELEPGSPAELKALRERWPVLWVDVEGVGDADAIAAIGEEFGLHRLALEDVMNTHQRPKVEEYPDYLFVAARMASIGTRVDTEQVTLFLGQGWVLTFQEHPGDPFGPVRDRLRAGRGRIRTDGGDYLLYALIDAIVDGFYPVLEEFGSRLEDLEEDVIADPSEELVGVIHGARRDALSLRHALWPMREAMAQLYRDPHPLITESTHLYLRDAYDHTIQVLDLLDNFREMGSALLDVYLSSVSQKMNEVMKVLTIIATIFIPLTFIVGVYGMNFNPAASPYNMPELSWYWGYPAVMALMLAIGLALLGYFRWKRWL